MPPRSSDSAAPQRGGALIRVVGPRLDKRVWQRQLCTAGGVDTAGAAGDRCAARRDYRAPGNHS